jgi:hypothetical protein
MKARVPQMNENDWVNGPQPSYDAYSFDIKPSYDNPIYDVDIDGLGQYGELPHPIPQYAGLSGYSGEAKRKIAWYVSKIKGAKSENEKKFYISKLEAFKRSLSSGSSSSSRRPSSSTANSEKILGGVLLFGLGYVVLNQIFG